MTGFELERVTETHITYHIHWYLLNLEQFSVHPYAGYFRNLLVAVRILALISYFNLANLHDWRLDRMDR